MQLGADVEDLNAVTICEILFVWDDLRWVEKKVTTTSQQRNVIYLFTTNNLDTA